MSSKIALTSELADAVMVAATSFNRGIFVEYSAVLSLVLQIFTSPRIYDLESFDKGAVKG